MRRDDAMEGPREIPWFDRVTGARGENQVMGGPRMRRGAEDFQLGMVEQRTSGRAEQRQVTTASVGFYRTKLKSAPGSQQLLAYTDDTMFQIHITPAQPEDLAAAEAVGEQQDERRVQPITARCSQEGERLIRRPRLLPSRAIGRQCDQPGDIAGHELLAHGLSQRSAQGGTHDMNLRDGIPGCQATVQPGLHNRHQQPIKPVPSQSAYTAG